jgi:hypothetical protein
VLGGRRGSCRERGICAHCDGQRRAEGKQALGSCKKEMTRPSELPKLNRQAGRRAGGQAGGRLGGRAGGRLGGRAAGQAGNSSKCHRIQRATESRGPQNPEGHRIQRAAESRGPQFDYKSHLPILKMIIPAWQTATEMMKEP